VVVLQNIHSVLLAQLLLNHIKEKLPEMRSKLSALIHSSEQELLQYGDPTWMAANVPAVNALLCMQIDNLLVGSNVTIST
jgi:hypothetical protein